MREWYTCLQHNGHHWCSSAIRVSHIEIYWIRQLKAVSAAQIKDCTVCFVLVVKYVFHMIFALEAQYAVQEPLGWARARRDWAVGGRICQQRCYLIEASVPLIWISGTDAPVLVSIWYDFVSVGPRFALFRDRRCRLCLDTYFCDCSEISKFWLHTLSVNAV